VKLLLKSKASVDAKDKNGTGILADACRHGYLDIMYLLLDAGAAVDSADKLGNGSLHYAAKYGFVDIVSALVSCGADVDLESTQRKTPLCVAIKHHQWDVIRRFRELGVHSEAADKSLENESFLRSGASAGFF
jgi:ankyrin repeat protein